MSTTLHLHCCKNIYREVEQAARSEHLDGLVISSFPSHCDVLRSFPSPQMASDPVVFNAPGNLVVLSCKTCPMQKAMHIPDDRRWTFDTVFNLFLDGKVVEQKIAQGGYLVTQGWLVNWREDSNLSGFGQQDLKTFIKEFAKKIVYIDSTEKSELGQIIDFSNYVDLPYEHIPVGLDYLKLFLKHKYTTWEMEQARIEARTNLEERSKQVADYASMFTILNELSVFTTEREVIDKIREILKMLLGATSITYFTATSFQEKYPALHGEILQSDFTYIDDGNGFAYAIKFRGEVLGIFQVAGFLFKQYVNNYLNFCLQTANILAVAVINIRNYRKILDMSLHDSLTGLKNRDYYENHLIEINLNKDCGVGIVVCDIDDLKIANDTLGHKAGDQLILRLAEILRMSFRDTDTICRIGGDEFVIFVKDCMPGSIEAISGRLENNLIKNNALYNKDPGNPSLSFSFGIAIHTEGDFDITEIFKTADERMYRKKRERKHTV